MAGDQHGRARQAGSHCTQNLRPIPGRALEKEEFVVHELEEEYTRQTEPACHLVLTKTQYLCCGCESKCVGFGAITKVMKPHLLQFRILIPSHRRGICFRSQHPWCPQKQIPPSGRNDDGSI